MKNQGNRKYWKKEAWRLCSLYIRQRDADKNGNIKCPTCNKSVPWKYADSGHFISREKESTLFDEINLNGQCKLCNGIKSGRQFEHGLYIDKKYGKGTAEKLLIKSKMECKRTWFDYYIIAEEFKQKLIDNGFKLR